MMNNLFGELLVPISANQSSCRLKAALITDRRVRIMNEVIVGVRVIKMYAWEYAFKRVVKALRR